MPDNTDPRVGQRRPGGRAAKVRAAVLRSTIEVLTDLGYDALSYEEVAARAGVHRTTVYRRWPNKADLVSDAVGLDAEQTIPIPDTGNLVGDLMQLARSVADGIGSPGGARRSRSIVAAAAASDELAVGVRRFMDRRIALSEPIVTRAVGRGEVPDGTDPRTVIEPVVGALWFRLLLTGEPIETDFVEEVAILVAAGARSRTTAAGERRSAGGR